MSFLNEQGLELLWSKISNNNKLLVNGINKKANKDNVVMLSEQQLTDSQKKQVKKNLDIKNPGEVVKNYEYTYEYTTDTDENSIYIYPDQYPDSPAFIKVAEIPEGEINYVGSTLLTHRCNTDTYIQTEITEEVLNRSLTYWEQTAIAVQPGLVQIMEHLDPYYAETEWETSLLICTRPGRYMTAWGGWVMYITIPQSGIYFRTGLYLHHVTLSFITSVTTYTDGSSSGTTTSSPISYKGNEIQAFKRGICIGDSVTEGVLDNSEGNFKRKGMSYPAVLKRLTGLDIVNAGIAGATSGTWYEYSLDSTNGNGDWVNNEWVWQQSQGTSLDYSGFEFAIIHLGINDVNYKAEDVTVEAMLEEYKININNIITKLKENNKGIKIFIATIIPSYAKAENPVFNSMIDKINEFVEDTENAYLLDLNAYSFLATHDAYNVWHPTALGYAKLGEEIKCFISYIINQNLDEFKNIQFIGTDYTF